MILKSISAYKILESAMPLETDDINYCYGILHKNVCETDVTIRDTFLK